MDGPSDDIEKTSNATASEPEDAERLEFDPSEFPLDRYEPVTTIGKGTVGTIYLARDKRLHKKKVAVKVLRAVSDDELVSFHQEARATSRLSHRSIIAILDFGATEGGVPFMVMEYVKGISLDRLVRSAGPLDQDRALKIAINLSDALAYAHSRGIFHRDIKSSNILVVDSDSKDPDVRLIDFGVAAMYHDEQHAVRVQGRTIVGTPQYMSPDQCYGLPYDERSEVYSLGCVLFEMLTGKLPYKGDTALEVIAMHANEEPPTLSRAHGGKTFINALENIISRCLAKNPEERYQSMYMLKVDLEKIIDKEYSITLDRIPAPESKHDRDPMISAIMIALVCFSLASWLAYMQIERILAGKNVSASVPSGHRLDMSSLPTLDEYSTTPTTPDSPAFVRSFNYGRLVIECPKPISDDDLKPLSAETELTELKLHEPRLSGRGFRYVPSVSKLKIERATISDEVLKHMATLKRLRHVEFWNCDGITAEGLKQLEVLPLDHVTAITCKLDDDALKEMCKFRLLTNLDFCHNKKVRSETIAELGKATDLRYFSISPEQLDPKCYESIARIKNLQGISFVGYQKVDKKELLALKGLPLLTRVSFSGECLNPDAVQSLREFPHLVRLELAGEFFGDRHVKELAGLHLHHLVLTDSSATEKGLAAAAKIHGLQQINLKRCSGVSLKAVNDLSKKLPSCDIVVL